MRNNSGLVYKVISVFLLISFGQCDLLPSALDADLLIQGKSIGDCQACKLFLESFKHGVARTARGKYEGGDAAWEEEKLKISYKHSEIRLVDIMESICKEVKKHSIQCHQMAEKAEEFIEEWWAQKPDVHADLFASLCIDNLKVCCPKNYFGKDCLPCTGDHGNLCSGNGKCRGDGTRKGNGTCSCFTGYTGDECNLCLPDYYISFRNDTKITCSPCHMSCMGGCRHGSQKDCTACKLGFQFDTDEGCLDVNECNDLNRCKKNEFCMNSIGSYTCIVCDKSCDGCHGDGPDMCRKCAKGYSKKGEFCVKDREEEDQASEQLTTTRYLTYIGLLIAVGILLPKSTSLGSLVGAMVLSYILGAEYYCMINGHSGLLNLKDYDLMNIFRM